MAKGFDRLAWVYDLMMGLVFGGAISKAQKYYFCHIKAGSKVLILGGGSGKFLKELLQKVDNLTIDYIEYSPKMMHICKKKLPIYYHKQVNFIQEDALSYQYNTCYDVIITPFFLDLFLASNVRAFIKKMSNHVAKSSLWLMTDYTTHGRLKYLKYTFVNFMYWVCAKFCQLENKHYWVYEEGFDASTWTIKNKKSFVFGMITTHLIIKD